MGCSKSNPLKEQERMAQKSQIWIFCHGCLNLKMLVNILGTTEESLQVRVRPGRIYGYKRAFGYGYSTLIESNDANEEVFGIAVKVSELELNRLDAFESYP